MYINELFKLQAELELSVSHISGIDENELGEENVLNVRLLALQVKLGELANLTKCYKYRKDINSIPKNKILFRYIEGMKYLLSIGNKYELNVIDDHAFENLDRSDDLIVQFSNIYVGITNLKTNLELDQYIESLKEYIFVLGNYIQLAKTLDISYDEAMLYFNNLSISA